jgi:hypothetical protein
MKELCVAIFYAILINLDPINKRRNIVVAAVSSLIVIYIRGVTYIIVDPAVTILLTVIIDSIYVYYQEIRKARKTK